MKKGIYSIFAASAMLLASCGENTETQTEEAIVEETAQTVVYNALPDQTQVNWHGEVAGVYGHDGYVNLKNATIETADNKIVGGEVVIDMTAFYATDTASFGTEEGSRITDLQGHLTQEDFFASATYPTSTFVIKSVNGNTVTGDLTIRDKTHEESLELSSLNVSADGLTMAGKLVFDRQKYDVSWVHYVKDMVLSDDIQVTFNLVAKM